MMSYEGLYMEKYRNYNLKKALKPVDTIPVTLFYRKISTKISSRLVKTNVTPNQMTIISFCIVLIAAMMFTMGNYIYSLIGVFLLNLGLILDCVDGEIARMKSLLSKNGALLDETLDNFGYSVVFLCIAYGIYHQTGYLWVWPLTLVIVTGSLMKSIVRINTKNLGLGNTKWKNVERKIGNSRFTLGWGGGIDEVLITIGVIFNQLIIVLIIICIGVNAHWIVQLVLNIRTDQASGGLDLNKKYQKRVNPHRPRGYEKVGKIKEDEIV
jgi:CDP-L-myo-inositol myo-inositolphosphotransferase